MGNVLLILQICGILIKYAPEAYHLFCEIMSTIKSTPENGNETSVKTAVKAVQAIIPIVDETTAKSLQQVIDEYPALFTN